MKHIFLLLTFIPGIINAQCWQQPECTNEVSMLCNDLSNQSTNQSTCFTGFGEIPVSYNWNNWQYITFNSTTASINVSQNLNFGGQGKKVCINGYHVGLWGNTSMSGGDTIFVNDGALLRLITPISNNSNPGQKNVVMLGQGSTLYVGINMVTFHAGDTIKTVLGNNSNNIYVVSCGSVPLSVKIQNFSIKDNSLYWIVNNADQIKIEYSTDSKTWNDIYATSQQKGNLGIVAPGFYRLSADDKRSQMIRYTPGSTPQNKRIYYYMGNFYNTAEGLPYYGTKR